MKYRERRATPGTSTELGCITCNLREPQLSTCGFLPCGGYDGESRLSTATGLLAA